MTSDSELLLPLRFSTVESGQQFGPVKVQVSHEYVSRFRFAIGHETSARDSTDTAIAAPALLLGNELLFLPFSVFNRETSIALHTYERLSFHGPLYGGEVVVASGQYSDKFVKRGQGYVRLDAEARTQDGRLILRHESLELVEAVGALDDRGSARPDPAWVVTGEVAKVPPIDRATPGAASRTPVSPREHKITQSQIDVFSWGDRGFRNSHTDLEIARDNLGADTTLVQALHQAAYIAEFAHSFFGDSFLWTGELELKFTAPFYSGETLTVEAVVLGDVDTRGGPGCELEVWVTADGKKRTALGRFSAAYATP